MTVALAVKPSGRRRGTVSQLARRVLSVPLAGKIIGANAIIVVAGVIYEAFTSSPGERTTIVMMTLALIAASILNVWLIRIALRPVKDLERVAERVSAGDFAARSVPSPFADADLLTLGTTINSLLDSLAAERRRIQDLGAEVIYAQDRERAKVSRELHDSIAQTLAAVKYQMAAAGVNASDEVRNHLAAISAMLSSVTEEIRDVSCTLHPRVAEDLGLESALTALARQIKQRANIDVTVVVNAGGVPVPGNVATALYRVAEEALKNVEMHAAAKNATVEVFASAESIRIVISDDGRGFDLSKMDRIDKRTGLASVKDRVLLAGGSVKIDSKPNGGTRVMAELQTSGVTK